MIIQRFFFLIVYLLCNFKHIELHYATPQKIIKYICGEAIELFRFNTKQIYICTRYMQKNKEKGKILVVLHEHKRLDNYNKGNMTEK